MEDGILKDLPIVNLAYGVCKIRKKIFCSSIPRFGIGYGEDIYKYLNQCMNYDLHILFI